MIILVNAQFAVVNNTRNDRLLKKLGKRLKALREGKGLSQEALAIEANVSISQIARIESGENNSTISTLDAIATALGIKVAELLEI